MRVQAEVLARVAELARLRLEPEEAERLQQELSRILDYVDSLAQSDGLAQSDEPAQLDSRAPQGTPLPDPTGRPSPDASGAPSSFPAHRPPVPLSVNPARLAPQWAEGFFVVPRLPAMDGTMDPPPPAADAAFGEEEQGG